ncbi:MAG: FHA domain-containing protein [Anaerolineae bacterium]|nr:FHA domain-containing protein [Thermoflexales bacterium]MDW8406921.1 FHA domain-containing protein [Anaerolineae bacterium]
MKAANACLGAIGLVSWNLVEQANTFLTLAPLSTFEAALLGLRILMVIALYAFFGLIMWVLLREGRSVQSPIPPARLIAQQDHVGAAYAVQHNTWIGRDPNCAVCVNDDFVSARHARLVWDAAGRTWWIEDNASRNGTWVNDERVVRCALSCGDIIRVGDVRFRFEV